MVSVLEAKNLSVAFGQSPVFSDVSLRLPTGTVTAILGPNGCGKTTLLRCLCGLLRPASGQVRLVEEPSESARPAVRDLLSLPPTARASVVGYVPQDAETSFGYTAAELVLMGRSARLGLFGTPSRHDELRARDELERLGIGHLADRSISSMSGGERRLVLIARALVTESTVLLLDEPTAHLDFRNQLLVHRILTQLTSERGIAVAFSTHLPTDAFGAATRALVMGRNGGTAFGPIEEVVTDDSLQAAFSVRTRIVRVPVNGKQNHVVVPIEPM